MLDQPRLNIVRVDFHHSTFSADWQTEAGQSDCPRAVHVGSLWLMVVSGRGVFYVGRKTDA